MAISVLRRMVDNTVLSRVSSTAMKSSTSMDSAEHKKTRHKLKKLLTGRPTLQTVKDKGYIKGAKEQQQHSKCFRFHFFCGKLKRCYKQQRFGNVMTAVKKHTSVLFFLPFKVRAVHLDASRELWCVSCYLFYF